MPGWNDFLTQLFGPAYSDQLPESAPKPPGYWAVEALRGGLIPTLGIPLGMMGSALDAYTENVPRRIGSLIGQAAGLAPAPVLQAIQNYGWWHPVAADLAKLGLAAQKVKPPPWGDPQVVKEAFEGDPLRQLVWEVGLDPTTWATLGTTGLGRAALKGAGMAGLIPVAEKVDRAAAYPFRKVGEGATAAVKTLGRGINRVAPSLLQQAPESLAGELTKHLEDAILNTPHFNTLRNSLPETGRYSMPLGRNGMPNVDLARRIIRQRWRRLEDLMVLNPFSAEDTAHNLQVWEAGQLARSQIQEELADSLAKELSSPGADALDAAAAYNAWFDRSNRLIDSIQGALRPVNQQAQPLNWVGPVPAQMDPTLAASNRLRDLAKGAMDRARKAVADARVMVDTVRRGLRPTVGPPVPQDIVRALINDIYRARNDEIIRSIKDAYRDIAAEFNIQLSDDADKAFREMLENLERVAVGGPGGAGYLPPRQANAMNELLSIYVPQVLKMQGAQHRISQHLAAALEMFPTDGQARRSVPLGESWQALQDRLQLAGLPPIGALGETTSKQLSNALAGLVQAGLARADEVAKLDNLLSHYSGHGDIMVDDPLLMALGPTKETYQRVLSGGDALSKLPQTVQDIGRAVGILRQLMREGWLANPAYFSTNMIAALGMNLFHGGPKAVFDTIHKFRVMMTKYDYGIRSPGMMTKLDLLPDDVADDLKAIGLKAPPMGLGADSYIVGNAATMSTRTAMERVPWYARAGLGAVTAPVDPLMGAIHVGAHIKGIPQLVSWIRNLTQIAEFAARSGLAQPVWRKELQESLPDFRQYIIDTLTGTKRSRQTFAGGVLSTKPVTPPPIQTILQEFDTQFVPKNGLFSPEDVAQWLASHNVHIDDVQALAERWAQIVDDAVQKGVAKADKIHVNYGQFTNLEAAIDKFIPFTRWAIRMIPNFRDIMMQSPGFVMTIHRLNSITKEDAEQMGLSPRYQRMIRVGGLGTWLAERLLSGRSGMLFVDPARVFMPWTQYLSGADNAQFARGPVEALFDIMPFKPYPDVQIPLQLGSAALASVAPGLSAFLPYSPEDPLPSISRFSGAAGLWGGNATEAWQTVARMSPGMNPYDYRTADIQRRIGEMAAQETGIANHPIYLAAREKTSHPIHKRAAFRASQERAAEHGVNMLLPLAVQVVGAEEAAAEKARRELPRGRRDTPEKQRAFDEALQKNPWAAAHLGVQGSDINTRLQFAFEMFRNPAVLFPDAHPDVAAMLAEQLAMYDRAPGPKAQAALKRQNPLISVALQRRYEAMSSLPEAKAYLWWRQQLHPQERAQGEEALMAQFIDWYRSGGRPPKEWY